MKTYGYARCSTNEDRQDINRQIRELKAAGVELQYILEKIKKQKRFESQSGIVKLLDKN